MKEDFQMKLKASETNGYINNLKTKVKWMSYNVMKLN